MSWSRRTKLVAGIAGLLVVGLGGYFGFRFVSKLLTWRHLDQTYQEDFSTPSEIAPGLNGKTMVFHFKTGLEQDDSQICVGFNVAFAAIEAGADVSMLFDAGAVLDLPQNLASTGIPVRLQKMIASQMNFPVDQMPQNYGAYLELLHRRGARVYADTDILVVTGETEQIQRKIPGYEFIEPVTYARVADLIAQAEVVVVY